MVCIKSIHIMILMFFLDARFSKRHFLNSSLLGNNQMERLFEEINKNGATFTFISPSPFLFKASESMINYRSSKRIFK